MSLFNCLFGEDDHADILLACLGLDRSSVGRYRTCYIDGNEIVIHTRNGGGNRECWHESNPEYGNKECKHHEIVKVVDEYVELTEEEGIAKGYKPLNIFVGSKRGFHTGEKVDQIYYVCEEPNTKACHCVGCFMAFHVHTLPNYLSDSDDDFDSTYADIRFSFPPEHKALLESLSAETGEVVKPREKWQMLFAALQKESA